MSEVKHTHASSLKKGSYVIIDGAACKVTDIKTSKPGKHGHAKINLTAAGLLDDKKRNIIMPGHDSIDVPIVDKRTAQVLSISGNQANVMDSETYETFDLSIPDEFKAECNEGSQVLYWVVLTDKVMKQVKSE